MIQYRLRIAYTNESAKKQFWLDSKAETEAEIIRTSHCLADLTELQGVEQVRVTIHDSCGRELFYLGDAEESTFLDRPVVRVKE